MIASMLYGFALQLPTVLAHFLWQGTAIGLIAIVANFVLQERSVQWCYKINLMLIVSFLFCIPTTFWSLSKSGTIEYASIEERPSVIESTATPNETVSVNSLEQDTVVASSIAAKSNAFLPRDSRDESLRIVVSAMYLAGVIAMLARTARAALQVRRLSRAGVSEVPGWLLKCLAAQAKRIGVAAVPAIRVCQDVSVPVVVGLLRPMVLMPVSMLSNLKHDEIEAILVHELAHIGRFDLWANLMQRLVEALLFFHPAVWYVSRQVSRCREVCCDEAVLAQGCDKLRYASALIHMAEVVLNTSVRDRIGNQMALAAGHVSSSEFNRRVCRLLGVQNRRGIGREWMLLSVTAGCVVAMCVAMVTSQSALAQEVEQIKTPAQKFEFLKKMVDAQRENVAKIHTWKADYEFEFRRLREDKFIKKTYLLVEKGDLSFSIDFDKNLLRSFQNPLREVKYEDQNGNSLDEPEIRRRARQKASRTEYLFTDTEEFQYEHRSLLPTALKDKIRSLPEDGVGRVQASMLWKEGLQSRFLGNYFHPAIFFSLEGRDSVEFLHQVYDELLNQYSDSSPERQDVWMKNKNIRFENGEWVLEMAFDDQVWRKFVFDSKLQSRLEYSWGIGDLIHQKIEANCVIEDGAAIPSKFVEIRYEDGKEASRSTYTLKQSEMNPSLPAEEFTLAAFKLPNGTPMADFRVPVVTTSTQGYRVSEPAMKVYLDGSWLSIDEYNAKVPD